MIVVDRKTNIDYKILNIKKHCKHLTFFNENIEILKYNMIEACNIIKSILIDYIYIT